MLIVLVFILTVLGLANLQFGSRIEDVKSEGVDVVLALDLSNSMMAEDVKPNRMERSKQFLYRLLNKLSNDRVGIIIFAGNAYIQMPLTIDYGAAKLFLTNLNTEIVPTQGTAIGEAIELSGELFESKSNKYKTLVILSDGENHEGNAIELAEKLAEQGVIIHTVGIGTSKGAPIPIYRGKQQVDFQRDKEGSIILSKINEIMLQEIASVGNGEYFRITNRGDDLNELMDAIASQEKKEIETHQVTEYSSKFQYFLALALILAVLEFALFEEKFKIRLFKKKNPDT